LSVILEKLYAVEIEQFTPVIFINPTQNT
jgi:hypothetical protein